MMDTDKERDIMDLSSPAAGAEVPDENQPKAAVERPTVGPQEGGYFLNKFLEQDKNEETADDEGAKKAAIPPASKDELEERIVEALREIYDPEIPVNIYEMGLIYGIDIDDDWNVKVTMTLTTPHCPVAESMPGEVELKVNSVEGVNGTEVSLVWEPAWDMSNMSDEARLELGLL